MADGAPALSPGDGRLVAGLLARPGLLGAGLRVDHSFRPWLSGYALGELGYSPDLGKVDWLASFGLRGTW